jgi:hypothetical protein
MSEHGPQFAKDLLCGADEIGYFVYADRFGDRERYVVGGHQFPE